MQDRIRLHSIIDQLSENDLTAARQLLESLGCCRDTASISEFPVQDELLSAEEQAALEATHQQMMEEQRMGLMDAVCAEFSIG